MCWRIIRVGSKQPQLSSRRGLAAGCALVLTRHAVILLFCLTTYAFSPVAEFGWLLIVLV
jgi:hypothetical protein